MVMSLWSRFWPTLHSVWSRISSPTFYRSCVVTCQCFPVAVCRMQYSSATNDNDVQCARAYGFTTVNPSAQNSASRKTGTMNE